MTTPRPTESRDDIPEGAAVHPAPTDAGGEAACWAHLVCDECGALEHDGHHEGCSSRPG
jgi:hypothetical protein